MRRKKHHLKLSLIALTGSAATIAAAFMLFGAAPAQADNGPHIASTGNTTVDRCAGCHRTHSATSSGLLNTSVSSLCASCHTAGTGALTDPWAGWSYPDFFNTTDMLGLRGGGFTTAALDTAHATAIPTKTVPSLVNAVLPVTSTHSIDGSAQTAWGGGDSGLGTQVSLTCTSCHDPHGNGNYRILRPLAKGGTGTTTVIPDATRKTYITTDYWNTQDQYSPGFISGISSWCSQCHTRYLSADGSTDTGDPTFTFRHKSTDNTPGGPNCIQCHVAHGSNANMNGTESSRVPLPGGAAAPSGDSRLLRLDNRGTCIMCHDK